MMIRHFRYFYFFYCEMMKANEYNEDKNTNEDKILYLLKYLIGKKEVGLKNSRH